MGRGSRQARRALGYATMFGGNALSRSAPFTVNDYVIVSTRMTYATSGAGIPQGVRYFEGIMTMRTPPWDSVSPRIRFQAFAGGTAGGITGSEVPIGNNLLYEGAWIEIDDVKYWFPNTSFGSTARASSHDVINGVHRWTSENDIFLPRNSIVRVGFALDILATGNCAPISSVCALGPTLGLSTPSGRGDGGSGGGFSRLNAITNNTTGRASDPGALSTPGTITGAPTAMVARPATPADAAIANATLLVGHSLVAGGNNTSAPSSPEAAYGLAQSDPARGLMDPNGPIIPYANDAHPGSNYNDLLNTPDPGIPGIITQLGWARRDASWAEVGYPWSTVYLGSNVNASGASDAGFLASINKAADAFKARGGRRVVIETMRADTIATGSPSGAFSFSGGDAYQILGPGSSVSKNAIILAKNGSANVDAVIDLRYLVETTPGSGKWKAGPSTTLAEPCYGPCTGLIGSFASGSNQITIESIATGTLAVSQYVGGAGIPNPTLITGQLSGTPGGPGVYTISRNTTAVGTSQTISSGGQRYVAVTDPNVITLGDALAVNPNATSTLSDISGLYVNMKVATNQMWMKGGVAKDAPINAPVYVLYTTDGRHGTPATMRLMGPAYAALRGTVFK